MPPPAVQSEFPCGQPFTEGDLKRTTYFKWMTLAECKELYKIEDDDEVDKLFHSKRRRMTDGSNVTYQTIYRVRVFDKWEVANEEGTFSIGPASVLNPDPRYS